MELWILLSVFAAFSQNIRSAFQKHLTSRLSTAGATQVRFVYALPFALIYLAILTSVDGYELPSLNRSFFLFATTGALAQLIASVLLIALFSHRNFFVGTAFSKTETIQAAVLGFVVLADELTSGAILGICIGLAGVTTIAAAKAKPSIRNVIGSLGSRASIIGLLIGLFFGISGICFRGASLSLSGGFVIQAAVTLTFALSLQTVAGSAYLLTREPGQMTALVTHWRVAILVGLAGMIASVGWFSAMTLQNAGYVRAVGQIELVFAFLASVIFFREKTTRAELLGVALIVVGIVVLLLLD